MSKLERDKEGGGLTGPSHFRVMQESPRKMQDEQEVASEAFVECDGVKRRRRVEGGGWNQKGKRRRQKPKFLRNGVEGVPGYPDGEGRHEWVHVTSSRMESEAPGEEGEEVKSPNRKVIRVESEETQDHVREAKDLNQEEADEMSFVPSVISVPQ